MNSEESASGKAEKLVSVMEKEIRRMILSNDLYRMQKDIRYPGRGQGHYRKFLEAKERILKLYRDSLEDSGA